MIGAGVFSAFAPGRRGGRQRPAVGLALAAVVAYCNAVASAQLAAQYPTSGGTYVYGRERLGEWWGFLAGWGFVVGKTATCAAMALTFAAYAVPGSAGCSALVARRGGRRARPPSTTAASRDGRGSRGCSSRLSLRHSPSSSASRSASGDGRRRDLARRSPHGGATGCCRPPGSCSSRSPATPGSRRSARRCATRSGRSRARSRSRSAIAVVVYAVVAVACCSRARRDGARGERTPLATAVRGGGSAGRARRAGRRRGRLPRARSSL